MTNVIILSYMHGCFRIGPPKKAVDSALQGLAARPSSAEPLDHWTTLRNLHHQPHQPPEPHQAWMLALPALGGWPGRARRTCREHAMGGMMNVRFCIHCPKAPCTLVRRSLPSWRATSRSTSQAALAAFLASTSGCWLQRALAPTRKRGDPAPASFKEWVW